MTRQVSLTALRSILAEQVEEVFLQIAVIDHPDLDEPLRLVSDRKELVRSDGTYDPLGFRVKLPNDEEENIGTINMIVPAVGQEIVQAIRSTNDPFTVELSVVKESDPDTVEVGPFTFESLGVNFDRGFATITLAFNRNMFEDGYPKDIFSPSNRP